MRARVQNDAQITALLISPNRDLAQQFLAHAAANQGVPDPGGS